LLSESSELDSVSTVSELDHRHHPFNLGKPSNDKIWYHIYKKERKEKKTRASKPKIFKYCNLIAVRKNIIREKSRFGDTMGYICLEELESWDIDYKWQLDIAESIIKSNHIKLEHMEGILIK